MADTERQARGDNKLAKNKLRGGEARQKTRHWSVFRTGVLLGIALPAFVDAIYRSKHAIVFMTFLFLVSLCMRRFST